MQEINRALQSNHLRGCHDKIGAMEAIRPGTSSWSGARPFSFSKGALPLDNLKVYGKLLMGHHGQDKERTWP